MLRQIDISFTPNINKETNILSDFQNLEKAVNIIEKFRHNTEYLLTFYQNLVF